MPPAFKRVLEKLAGEKAPGPTPTFTLFHLLDALELISTESIGRNKLAENLNIGKGVIRTIVSRLKDAGLVKVSETGCSLTRKGAQLWREYATVFRKAGIQGNTLASADHNFAVLVKNHGDHAASGMEQRDAAIRIGAGSVTTIICRLGKLVIPSVTDDMAEGFPAAAKQVVTLLKPEENDVVVIASADDEKTARYGALAAAWTLIADS